MDIDEKKKHRKLYYEKNKEEIIKKNAIYKKNHKEATISGKKKYRENNREKIKAYWEKQKSNPIFKIRKSISKAISKSIKQKNFKKHSKTVDILGCSVNEFKIYLELKFESWMTWDNYGKYNGQLNYGWDIDHTIPLCTATTEEEIIKLNHYTNLQPLCGFVNRYIKRDKIL